MTDNIVNKSEREHTITELCHEFGVTARALRFYEAKKLLLPNRRGQARRYSQQDRERLQLILRSKRYGFTLNEIKNILDLYDRDDGQLSYKRAMLPKLQSQLLALQKDRDDLGEAIANLTQVCQSVAETLSQQPDAAIERPMISRQAV